MKKLLLTILSVLALASPAFAQVDPYAPGTASSNTDVAPLTSPGMSTAEFTVTGTWSATLTFNGSGDNGSTYHALPCVNVASGALVSSTTANGIFRCSVGGEQRVKGTVSSYSSGTVAVSVVGGRGIGVIDLARGVTQGGTWSVRTQDGSGNAIGSTTGALNVSVANASLTIAQATASSLNAQIVGTIASGSTDSGNPVKVGGKYNSSNITLTNGQRGDLQLDAAGFLKVNVAAGSTSAPTDTDDGTIAGGQTVGINAVFLHYWNGSNWVRASPSDGTVGGTILTTGPQILCDGSSSAPTAVTSGQPQYVWCTTGGAVNIADGGGSITVDGTVAVSGTVTVDTEITAPAALANSTANPTVSSLGAYNMIYNGSTWDRWTGAVTATATGNVASAATDSGNPVKIGGIFNTTQPTVTNGQRVDAQMTARGAQIIAVGVDGFSATVTQATGTNLHMVCDSGCSSSTAPADNSTFTAGTTSSTPISGFYHATRDNLTDGRIGALALTQKRAAYVTFETPNGDTLVDETLDKVKVSNGTAADLLATVSIASAQTLATVTTVGTLTGGGVASGATDSGNPVKIGGVFLTTQPTVTNGQRVDFQTTARGAQIVATGVDAFTVTQLTSTLKRYISVGTTEDESEVKATAGTLMGISARNANASTDAFLKCTNLTAANTTPGTSTVIYELMIPKGGGFIDRDINVPFSTALTCYIVTGKLDNDATEVAANDVSYNLTYR